MLTGSHRLATKPTWHQRTMTRFVLRNGEVFESQKDPTDFDTFCYGAQQEEQTCHLLSVQSEIAFLMMLGDELNLRYEQIES